MNHQEEYDYRNKLEKALSSSPELPEDIFDVMRYQVTKSTPDMQEAAAKEMLSILETCETSQAVLDALSDHITVHFAGRHFERAVRRTLNKWEGPITEIDLFHIKELDCGDFDVEPEDFHLISAFRNLESLDININSEYLDVVRPLKKLADLYVETWPGPVDLGIFAALEQLECLGISGGLISSMDLCNASQLKRLKKLTALTFHEFGSVDLAFLRDMPELRDFSCGWANEIYNASAIGSLKNLESLSLCGEPIENLDFLDELPDSVYLDICGLDILDPDYDVNKLFRFKKHDICEVTIADETVIP